MYFFSGQRHWPVWVKRHWPEFGIVTMFWIRGTGLLWITMFLRRHFLFDMFEQKNFSPRDCFGGSYFLLFLSFSPHSCLSQTTVGGAYRLV